MSTRPPSPCSAEARMEPHRVVAFNTATASANKIHDDEVATRLGFRGGLVPGVDVYAYLCHPPAARWGLDWLRHGTMRARFHSPVYDGHEVEVTSPDGSALQLRDGDELCAEGAAGLGDPVPAPDPADWPDVEQSDDPPPAAPEVLVPGTAFGLAVSVALAVLLWRGVRSRLETAAYVGLIGSDTKRARFRSLLAQAGVAERQIEAMVCPIGLPGIRSNQPNAIAASVVADLLCRMEQCSDARNGASDNDRQNDQQGLVRTGGGRQR